MLSAFRYTFLCQREERGGIAQLGERLHGMQEVRGSIPLVSTISTLTDAREILHPFFLAINIHPLCGWIFIALPFAQPPVIKQFFCVLDDERDNGVAQAHDRRSSHPGRFWRPFERKCRAVQQVPSLSVAWILTFVRVHRMKSWRPPHSFTNRDIKR